MASCNILENSYIVPVSDSDIVILTDQEKNYGVMEINNDILAISSETIRMFNDAFFIKYPATVSQLNDTNNNDLLYLVKDLSDNKVIYLAKDTPARTNLVEYDVEVGDIINQNSAGTDPIIAEYRGRVFCATIGRVTIYIYFSFTPLTTINCEIGRLKEYSAVLNYGNFGTTIMPKPTQMALGANCSVCGACGGCGACGACALCGGLNFGAAAIAIVAVDSVLAVAGTLSAFAVSRD